MDTRCVRDRGAIQIFKTVSGRAVVAGCMAVAALGCSPSAPSPPPPAVPVITSITPNEGLAGLMMIVFISGTGFQPGAAVTLGTPADSAVVLGTTSIRVTTPSHTQGPVDVVVTNPTGESARIVGGYIYGVVTLTASATLVAPGAPLGVSWVAPGRANPGTNGDWIGLFRVGDPNSSALASRYTTGVTGTFVFTAPAEPGQYEFRYFVNDDFILFGRSATATVSANNE